MIPPIPSPASPSPVNGPDSPRPVNGRPDSSSASSIERKPNSPPTMEKVKGFFKGIGTHLEKHQNTYELIGLLSTSSGVGMIAFGIPICVLNPIVGGSFIGGGVVLLVAGIFLLYYTGAFEGGEEPPEKDKDSQTDATAPQVNKAQVKEDEEDSGSTVENTASALLEPSAPAKRAVHAASALLTEREQAALPKEQVVPAGSNLTMKVKRKPSSATSPSDELSRPNTPPNVSTDDPDPDTQLKLSKEDQWQVGLGLLAFSAGLLIVAPPIAGVLAGVGTFMLINGLKHSRSDNSAHSMTSAPNPSAAALIDAAKEEEKRRAKQAKQAQRTEKNE